MGRICATASAAGVRVWDVIFFLLTDTVPAPILYRNAIQSR